MGFDDDVVVFDRFARTFDLTPKDAAIFFVQSDTSLVLVEETEVEQVIV